MVCNSFAARRDLCHANFAPFQLVNLSCHPLNKIRDLVAGRFANVNGKGLSSAVAESKIIIVVHEILFFCDEN